LHKISNDNGVRLVNLATSKNLTVKSTMFPHRNIYKYTWMSPDGKPHNQIEHILVDRRRHSNVLDVRSFRVADCNNYGGISLLSTPYKNLSNILLSRLVPYIDEIIGDHQCGFGRNRSTTDQIFCIVR
jgi:hypothetical protein